MSQETHASGALARLLPTFVIILMAIQPLMDILSFWTDRLGMSNTITLLLGFAVFAVVCLLGFFTSARKKVYGIAVAACAVLLIGHCISCFIVGYQRIVYDLTNFVRVVQYQRFLDCLRNTVVLCVPTVLISSLLALLIAVFLNSIKWLQRPLQTIFFLPYVTNSIAIGMVFAAMFNIVGSFYGTENEIIVTAGIINNIIEFFGGEPVNWINYCLLYTSPSPRD